MRCISGVKSLALTAAVVVAMGTAASANADPVWDRIKASSKIVCGAIPNDPIGSWVDKASGQWEGYEIDLCRAMAADLSKDMGKTITPEFRETSWKTIVLDVQAEKIDIWPGMSATPERQKALQMIGPIYGLTFCGMPSKTFQSDGTWESLNKSSVRIATVTGSSIETAFKKMAPNAQHITLTEYAEVALAVQSGRADVMGADALRCLTVLKDAPKVFGSIIFPKPVQSMGSSAGVIKAADQFGPWIEKWAKQKQASGEVKGLFIKTFGKAGLDASAIPSDVQF